MVHRPRNSTSCASSWYGSWCCIAMFSGHSPPFLRLTSYNKTYHWKPRERKGVDKAASHFFLRWKLQLMKTALRKIMMIIYIYKDTHTYILHLCRCVLFEDAVGAKILQDFIFHQVYFQQPIRKPLDFGKPRSNYCPKDRLKMGASNFSLSSVSQSFWTQRHVYTCSWSVKIIKNQDLRYNLYEMR